MSMGSEHEQASYQDLVAWQRSRVLVRLVYETTASLPADERFGLTSQMRRAAVSIMSNIAEGYGRGTPQDFGRFLRMSRASLFELETQAIAALDLGFINEIRHEQLQSAINGVAKPLSGLVKKYTT